MSIKNRNPRCRSVRTSVRKWATCVALALGSAASVTLAQATAPAAGNDIQAAPAPKKGRPPTYALDPDIKIPEGKTKLDWDSVIANYKVPQWLQDGKFGIFIHWGLYSVPAHHNEWYAKHMYGNGGIIKWHADTFGPQDKFGYKDFIPLFKAEKFDADEWASLFKKAGATWVIPCGEHHDKFAMWDSALTKWNAAQMGPKKDIIGLLAKSVRANGMKFGISNHRMFGYDFMLPAKGLKTDLYDPAYADFYGPPPQNESWPDQPFVNDWLARTVELIDKYQPDFLWFDWDGTGGRIPPKLQFAAYYQNRAQQWGKEIAWSAKGGTFPDESGVASHEKGGRMPKDITKNVWMVDDIISTSSWGYTDDMKYRSAGSIVLELIDATSRNGTLMLNISPRGDGSIPDEQKKILADIGKWLAMNGEAIYGTRPWKQAGDGDTRFTTKGDTLYAILRKWPDGEASIPALKTGALAGDIAEVSLLGRDGELKFKQGANGLTVTMPKDKPGDIAYALKITVKK